jgi:adenylylsulfate kinase
MAAAPAYESAAAILSPPSDAETLDAFTPQDDDARAKEDFINSHPLAVSLRANPDLIESRPHMKIPPSWRRHNLTGGTLAGPGKMAIPPFSWTEREGKSYVQVTHVGTDLCGHKGIIHGGFLATMLDEGLARCCFPVLPFNVGMTAKLEINYKVPAVADQYLVLRATTVKVEGRKAWVEGHIETLPSEEGQEPTILATASALYVSPKQAAVRNIKPLQSPPPLHGRPRLLTRAAATDDGEGLPGEIDMADIAIPARRWENGRSPSPPPPAIFRNLSSKPASPTDRRGIERLIPSIE